MAKPTIDDTRWAVTGGGSESGSVSNPASGLKDTGYASNAIPTSLNYNWWKRKAHKWFQYLDTLIDGSDNWAFPAIISHKTPTLLAANVAALQGTAIRTVLNVVVAAAADGAAFPITLPVVSHISQITLWFKRTDDTAAFTFALKKAPLSTGTPATVATTTVSGAGASATPETVSLSSLNYTPVITEQAWVEVFYSGAGNFTQVFGIVITP